MKKTLKIMIASVLVLSVTLLAGCNKSTNSESALPADNTSSQSESAATADQPQSDRPVILVVSFGTSYNDTRDKTIGAIENKIAETYPEYEVRRAFTSQIIIDKLKERDNLEIDNVEEAFDRLVSDGVKKVVVQPTHLMNGFEYDDLAAAVKDYTDKFDEIAFGKPLLSNDDDIKEVAKILPEITKDYNTDGTAVVFMGHGTEHESNEVYTKLQTEVTASGAENYFIGTVEAEPSIDDMVTAAKNGGYSKVVLQPLMVVAGDHANNDMAGDEDDSWKSVFEKEGFEVECVLSGLGEFDEIQQLYADHVGAAIDELEK
ncbi:MAG: sirohydrochlorin cobaltochelatase [Clostridia bacterium]|nr:sirohydrochlorin cobaltochelatase [Clostridia bacterium]